jgi:hypothetical protein
MCPHALWLPSAFTLTDGDVSTVCEHIKTFTSARVSKTVGVAVS